MLQLFKLPLIFLCFYLECRKSPVIGKRIKWTQLFSFMVKVRLLFIVKGRNTDVSVHFGNYTMHASDYKSLEYLFHEIFVLGEYHYPEDGFNPEVIFDCGANIGMTTLFFKMLYPNVKIRAFEPNPAAFYLLSKNIETNNLLDVFAHQVALSDTSGELELFYDDSTLVTGSLYEGRAVFNHSVKVQSMKLSDFCACEEKIDLLKIDVEGAERLIVSELEESRFIQKPVRYLIEYHNNADINAFHQFLSLFTKYSYRVQLGSGINRRRDFQDILIYLK